MIQLSGVNATQFDTSAQTAFKVKRSPSLLAFTPMHRQATIADFMTNNLSDFSITSDDVTINSFSDESARRSDTVLKVDYSISTGTTNHADALAGADALSAYMTDTTSTGFIAELNTAVGSGFNVSGVTVVSTNVHSEAGAPVWAIVLGICGGVLLCCACILLIWCMTCRKKEGTDGVNAHSSKLEMSANEGYVNHDVNKGSI